MGGFLDNLPDLGLGGDEKRRDLEKKIAKSLPTVYWRPVKCPACGSKKCPVTSTVSPVRYHKCLDCGLNFKSVEETGY